VFEHMVMQMVCVFWIVTTNPRFAQLQIRTQIRTSYDDQ
jgi:hypothetical protein